MSKTFTLMLMLATFSLSSVALAAAAKEFVLTPSKTSSQLLKQLKASREKARIVVVLHSGKEYSGRIGAIGESAFTLNNIDGKEFYDVVISFNHVEAIEIQMRNLPQTSAAK